MQKVKNLAKMFSLYKSVITCPVCPEPGGLSSGCVPPNETFHASAAESFSNAFPPPSTSYSSLVPSSRYYNDILGLDLFLNIKN